MSWPSSGSCHPAGQACLRVTMKVAKLSTAAPASPDTDTDARLADAVAVPAAARLHLDAPSCKNGGANFMVYAESSGGGAVSVLDRVRAR